MSGHFLVAALVIANCCIGLAADDTFVAQKGAITGKRIPWQATTFAPSYEKRYGEMTAVEQQHFRTWYEDLDERDEPPYPANGLRELFADIAKIQKKLRMEGLMLAVAHVDEHGDAQTVSIVQIPNEAAKAPLGFILIQTKYKPGLCDGTRCAMDFPVYFNFEP